MFFNRALRRGKEKQQGDQEHAKCLVGTKEPWPYVPRLGLLGLIVVTRRDKEKYYSYRFMSQHYRAFNLFNNVLTTRHPSHSQQQGGVMFWFGTAPPTPMFGGGKN